MVRKSSSAGNRPQTKRKPGTVRERFRKLRAFVTQGQAMLRETAGPTAVSIWFTLWQFEDAASGSVSIGRRSLQKLVGCDESTVKRSVRDLIGLGYLKLVRKGVIGRSANVYTLSPLPAKEGSSTPPLGGSSTPPVQKARGGTSDPKEGAPVTPIQMTTSSVSGGPADGSASRHDVPLRFPVGDPPESSAPERQTPLAWLAEAIRRAGGTMPGAEASRLADRPGGPGFRAINRVLENLKPDDGINSTFDGGKLVLTLSEA